MRLIRKADEIANLQNHYRKSLLQVEAAVLTEKIWQNLLEREKQFAPDRATSGTRQGSGGNSQVDNQSIWLDMCRGHDNRKGELTALSVEAADCLRTGRNLTSF